MVEVGELLLLPGIPAVLHKNTATAIIADLHLGFEDEMAEVGVYLPRRQLTKAIALIEELRNLGAKRLVINGDIKNSFNKLTFQEREEIIKFFGKAKDMYDDVVLVRGNHDNYVSIITEKMDVRLVPHLKLSEHTFIIHGHRESEEALRHKIIIIGHEHPSFNIRDEIGSVLKMPCFLRVPLKSRKKEILVLPAAGFYQSGNPISLSSEGYLSPLIRKYGDINMAVPIVIDAESRDLIEFPPLGAMEGLVRIDAGK